MNKWIIFIQVKGYIDWNKEIFLSFFIKKNTQSTLYMSVLESLNFC